ncbi:MAG: hypothetical protein KAW17_04505 [Candidatus Eisenbacteria sp.]|nr:hypothetical protein [Candidatus Eisenbacteria bacterium]
MGNRYRLISLLVVAVGALVASTGPALGFTLEDFEAYVNNAELNAAWVPSSNGTEFLEATAVFERELAMGISYNCGLGDFSTVFTYDVAQDWTSFTTFSLMYLGTAGSSSERLVVELRDQWGNYVRGPAASGATQALGWTEYSMDISGWADREWMKEIRIWVEADGSGSGSIYFDYLLLPNAISVDGDTWSRIKSIYGNKKRGQ